MLGELMPGFLRLSHRRITTVVNSPQITSAQFGGAVYVQKQKLGNCREINFSENTKDLRNDC